MQKPRTQGTIKRAQRMLKDKGMSMAELSKATGIPNTTMSNYFNRGSKIPIENLERIAEELEVSAYWLRTGVGPVEGITEEINEIVEQISHLEANRQAEVITALHTLFKGVRQ